MFAKYRLPQGCIPLQDKNLCFKMQKYAKIMDLTQGNLEIKSFHVYQSLEKLKGQSDWPFKKFQTYCK